MKQASSRELFGYWTARRGTRAAPERGEIEPSAIRRALGDVFILEFDRLRRPSVPSRRNARLRAVRTRAKNEPFLDLWDAAAARRSPNCSTGSPTRRPAWSPAASGRTAEGWAQDLELVLLPLAHRGDTHARMIGALAPLAAAVLARRVALGALTLGKSVISIRRSKRRPPRGSSPAAGGGAARGFTVYEGGRH